MEIIGIGLANIDLIAHIDEAFLKQHKLIKGQAARLDDLAFARIRADLPTYEAAAGGCVANTLCGLAAHGVDTRFFGKVGADSFESLYRAGFRRYMVAYDVEAKNEDTSQCLVLITPDGERSFAYTRGASWRLSSDDLDLDAIRNARFVYTEIYALEFGRSGGIWPNLINTLRDANVPLGIKIVDRAYAELYRAALFALAEEGVLNIIVGNTENLPTLAHADSKEEAIERFKKWPCTVLMTDGVHGAYVIEDKQVYHQSSVVVENPKNTSGAGDQFMAGYLLGWLDERDIGDCLKSGETLAQIILDHDSPRPPLQHTQPINF